jgi:hypothetical protein
MAQAALDALLSAYREQAVWLLTQAGEFEGGKRKLIVQIGGKDIDLSKATADEYRNKAGNLHAIIAAYERLHTKEG